MKIKKIVALSLIIAVLAASGCASDPSEKEQKDKGQPIIEYSGVVVDKDDVTRKMNYYVTQQNMTVEDLSEGADKEIWERFKNDIIFELSVFQIALKQAKELGLDVLSAAEQQKVDATYDAGLKTGQETVKKDVDAAVAENSALDYDAEFDRQLKEYFYLHGYDLDTYKDALTQEFVVSKVKDHFTKDITITDEEVKAKYDYDLEVQKSNMEKQPASIEQQMLFGTEVLYYPEGYMYAKHILVSFDSADSGNAAIAYVDGDIAEYNRIIAKAMPKIQSRVDDLMRKLDDGADFDELMAQYSDDGSLNVEPYKTEGFLIGPYSAFDLSEYLAALGTLKASGEYTEPVTTYMGCYIIKCEKMLAGPVPFDEIKASYKLSLLDQRKSFAWSTLGKEWIDEAKAAGILKLFPERLN